MRKTLATAGMLAIVSLAFSGTALAVNPTFAPAPEAASATADQTASAQASDVQVLDSVTLESDSYAQWGFIDNDLNYLKQSSGDGYYLLDAQGATLAGPMGYLGYINGAGADNIYPFFQAQDVEGLNASYALDAAGAVITDAAYAEFTSVDGHWLCGLVLAQAAEGAEYDYTSGDGNLVIDHVDIFYDGVQVASVGRDQYGPNLQVVDGYLLIQDRNEDVCRVYAPTGEVVNEISTSVWLSGDEYYTDEAGMLRFVSGAQVGTPDCTLTYDDVTNPYLIGADGVTVYDIYGSAVATLDFQVTKIGQFVDGYAAIKGATASGEYLWGVVDSNWNLVVPLEYDQVGARYTDVAFSQGYCYVERNGMFGYLAKDGSVAVPLDYAVSAQKYQGDLYSIVASATGGYQIVSAADGLEPTVYSDVYTAYTGTFSPLAQVADANGLWGVVDYHGNEVVACAYEYSHQASTSADGTLILLQDPAGGNRVTLVHVGNALASAADAGVSDLMLEPEEGGPVADAPAAGEAADVSAAAKSISSVLGGLVSK